MTLILDLPPEQEMELQKQAAEQGLPSDRYALDLLLEQIQQKAKARPFYETATTEEWIAAFHEWVYSHDPNGPVLLDDSREVIYEDRL